jgi:hypothetical protein
MQVRRLREAQRRDAQDAAWPGRVQNALQRLRLDVGQDRRFPPPLQLISFFRIKDLARDPN